MSSPPPPPSPRSLPCCIFPRSFGRLALQSAALCLAWKRCQCCPITMLLSSGSPAQSIPLQQPRTMPSRHDSAVRPPARVRARTGARARTRLLRCWRLCWTPATPHGIDCFMYGKHGFVPSLGWTAGRGWAMCMEYLFRRVRLLCCLETCHTPRYRLLTSHVGRLLSPVFDNRWSGWAMCMEFRRRQMQHAQ